MAGRIIGAFCCLLCAFPFYAMPSIKIANGDPINFWSGDEIPEAKLRDVEGYNREMAKVFKRYGLSFLLNAVTFALAPALGAVLLVLNCTLAIYLFYRAYKKILMAYSVENEDENSGSN